MVIFHDFECDLALTWLLMNKKIGLTLLLLTNWELREIVNEDDDDLVDEAVGEDHDMYGDVGVRSFGLLGACALRGRLWII